ncbi:hypothetical protein HYC85_013533 [Camellia sinensis]|uniref:ABC-type xenobiotic transporter n=1 Tax=Camellia sinensis TaxID=4442 RepID=A0A7J7H718_CAMSI|nr:hypothetical protein HYC85_013533 [Camellia sinensis]
MTIWWLNPLMKRGREKTLEDEDIPKLREEDQAQACYLIFTEKFNEQKQLNPSSQPSVLWTIVSCHWKEIFMSGLFALLTVVTLSTGPLILNTFIEVAEGRESFKNEGYVLAILLFFSKSIESLAQRQWYFRSKLIGLKVRSLLTAAIYKKQLRLSIALKMMHSAGEIMNYVSTDAYRIGEFPFWFHQTWTTSLQLYLVLIILFRAVGLALIASLVVIILTVLCNAPLAKLQHKFQSKLMVAQDDRLNATSEALVNVKVLKLYAWESHFKNVIENLRKVEYKWLSAVQMLKAYNAFLFWVSPVLVSTATFGACYFLGVPLHASNVFTFVVTLRLVQEPVRCIPDVIGVVIQAKVAFARIVKFLEAPELENTNIRKKRNMGMKSHNIFINSASFLWKESSLKPTLRNINLEVRDGEKVAICGEVGSGKSTVLAAILGEVPNIQGTLMSDGEILQAAPYHQLLASSREFQDLVNAHKETGGAERLEEVSADLSIVDPDVPFSFVYSFLSTINTYANLAVLAIVTWQVLFISIPMIYLAILLQRYYFSAAKELMRISGTTKSFVANHLAESIAGLMTIRAFGEEERFFVKNLDLIDINASPFFHCFAANEWLIERLGVLSVVVLSLSALCMVLLPPRTFSSGGWKTCWVPIRSLPRSHTSWPRCGYLGFGMPACRGESDLGDYTSGSEVWRSGFPPVKNRKNMNMKIMKNMDAKIITSLLQKSGISCCEFENMDLGFVGMALSYGLSLNMSLVFSIQNQCTLANLIISVERLNQYMHIPSEAPEVIEANHPPANWLIVGEVKIQDLKIKYRPDAPIILRGITCTFERGHKIGIVGRTGSGKSALIGALFRLVEPVGGKIVIDEIDISTIGLHDLRSRFGIIPQDPTLFNGTVRYNLDPLGQHTDQEIWEVLGKCQLGEVVQEKEAGLDSMVVQDGSNWSIGQRQLFCLGRALLRRSKILVLDEATASINNATDLILQRTIRIKFPNCTMITVAHRIPTIMDSTMVIAMSDEKPVEYDEPLKLMKRENLLFGQLVKEYWSHYQSAESH